MLTDQQRQEIKELGIKVTECNDFINKIIGSYLSSSELKLDLVISKLELAKIQETLKSHL